MTHKQRTEYLYGFGVSTWMWRFLPYVWVLRKKIKLAELRIERLNRICYMNRPHHNITDCLKAIKFNNEMIEETK